MSVRTKAQLPVGCAQWVQDENSQISQFISQEAEDFAFSARNEVEWLNEHMAEIFSKNQVNVTEIFKTPGKLRGKTPRTARKRNALETRQPLTDIFSTNVALNNSPSYVNRLPKEVSKIQVAQVSTMMHDKTSKPNTDSGYHGMSEDDMEVDQVITTAPVVVSLPSTQEVEEESISSNIPLGAEEAPQNPERQRTTEGSFHSALEEITKKEVPRELPELPEEINMDIDSNNPAGSTNGPQQSDPSTLVNSHPSDPSTLAEATTVSEDAMDLGGTENESFLEENPSIDASHSSSVESSPAKPLVRKSSLTFAALPAREPLTTKKSIGPQTSGSSHFEQPRTTMNRGSFLGRFTGGKSMGSLRQPDFVHSASDDEMDVDKAEKPALAREESDGDTKITRLHNKSSTQRLHEKINMLGKSQPARLTKSIPAAAVITQPNYPDLAAFDSVPAITTTTTQVSAGNKVVSALSNDEDDDDWIQPPPKQPGETKRPQLPKSISADVMEDIRGKRNISDQQFGIGNHDRDAIRESSPLRQNVVADLQCSERRLSQSALTHTPKPSLKTDVQSLLEIAAASKPALEQTTSHAGFTTASTTPIGTPSVKQNVDGPLSASKSKLQSIMKTARGLFTSSAGVSAQAKMETMSPHSTRKRGRGQVLIENEIPSAKLIQVLEDKILPDSRFKEQTKAATFEQGPNTLKKSEEGRKTRSSTEKEVKRKEEEAKERERIEFELEQSRETEERKAATQNRDLRSANLTDVNQHAEVEESYHTKQNKPTRQSPRHVRSQQKEMIADGYVENQLDEADNSQKNHLKAPPLNPPQQPSHIQRPKELRRPVKPAKEAAPKPKPQPVAIRVGTLSQRIPLTNAALSSTLQESLPQPPSKQSRPIKKPSTASLQTSASNNSLKSSVTSNAPKPKALLAAERKKEQDEKEVQRKLEQKREIERKRAAQQEEIRRQEQAQRQEIERQRERERAAAIENPRKVAQRQAIEKRRLEVMKKEQQRQGAQHEKSQPPPKHHAAQDFNRPTNQPPINPARPIKRVFDPETDDEPFRPVRTQGATPYQQSDAKRRRTEDEEVQEVIIRPTMAPPIRQSNIRKDGPKQSIYTNGYTSAQAPSNPYHHSTTAKQSTLNQTYQQQQHQHPTQVSRVGVPNEMAKYTHGKIPFAEVPNPPLKSPHRARQATAAPGKSSPHCVNGENIELDEILTDDEDSDSEDDKAKGAMIADWAKSPFLGDQLETQERYADPDEIFGPVGSPHMEEMFKGREHRYRNRTSSANWAGSDRLTEEEIRSDRAAREKLRRQGGWSFEL